MLETATVNKRLLQLYRRGLVKSRLRPKRTSKGPRSGVATPGPRGPGPGYRFQIKKIA